jgi:hypothetical protein
MKITQLALYRKMFGGSAGGGGSSGDDDADLEWSEYVVNSLEYDLDTLPSGIYKIKIITANGVSHKGSFAYELLDSWNTTPISLESGISINIIRFYIEGPPGSPPDADYVRFDFGNVGSVSTFSLAKIE